MAVPPINVLSIAPRLIAAELRLIIVPRLSGTCSSARVAIVVIVVPAIPVPIIEEIIARGKGKGILKYAKRLRPPIRVDNQVVVFTPSFAASLPLNTCPAATVMNVRDMMRPAVSRGMFKVFRMYVPLNTIRLLKKLKLSAAPIRHATALLLAAILRNPLRRSGLSLFEGCSGIRVETRIIARRIRGAPNPRYPVLQP